MWTLGPERYEHLWTALRICLPLPECTWCQIWAELQVMSLLCCSFIIRLATTEDDELLNNYWAEEIWGMALWCTWEEMLLNESCGSRTFISLELSWVIRCQSVCCVVSIRVIFSETPLMQQVYLISNYLFFSWRSTKVWVHEQSVFFQNISVTVAYLKSSHSQAVTT